MKKQVNSTPGSNLPAFKAAGRKKQRIILHSLLLFCFFLLLNACNKRGAVTCEWPCFHGPDRTNKSAEVGLLKNWPEGGPELLWTASGLGSGYSSVIVANGLVYTAGIEENQTCVFAFDLSGELAWKRPNGDAWSTDKSWARSYTGARSTPTYDDGVIFHLGENGRLAAFESKTGKELWHRDIIKEYDPEITEYGYSESVAIQGDKLFVRPAGKKGYQVCLDKSTGDLIWANTDIPGSEGYTSPVFMDFEGKELVLGASSNCYYGVDAESGSLAWKVGFENQRGLNISDPIVSGSYVFISSGYGKGSMLVQLVQSDGGIMPDTVWQSELMDNHHGGVILHQGYLYGSGSKSKGWHCLDLLSGEQVWNIPGKGSSTFADGMLFLLDERGSMRLIEASPDAPVILGEFSVPNGGDGLYWAHPVVCGGRLYVRHADKLYVYMISEEV